MGGCQDIPRSAHGETLYRDPNFKTEEESQDLTLERKHNSAGNSHQGRKTAPVLKSWRVSATGIRQEGLLKSRRGTEKMHLPTQKGEKRWLEVAAEKGGASLARGRKGDSKKNSRENQLSPNARGRVTAQSLIARAWFSLGASDWRAQEELQKSPGGESTSGGDRGLKNSSHKKGESITEFDTGLTQKGEWSSGGGGFLGKEI